MAKAAVSLALIALATLVGCSSTPADLRRDERARFQFVVNENYQLVFKRIVEHLQECYGGPLLPVGSASGETMLYPDLRTATVVRGATGVGTQTNLVIDIRETDPGVTEVVAFNRFWALQRGQLIRGAAEGRNRCP